MDKIAVINVVGLSSSVIGKETPFLQKWIAGKSLHYVKPAFPAVTCTAQANYLTGKNPKDHGIVGNGWYFKDECEVKFWKQSNKLVQGKKIWETAKDINRDFTCANLFWWYNMYSSVDYSVTPRPQYPASGLKIPDVYTYPSELGEFLQHRLGTFPLFNFWGPTANIKSSDWIAQSAKMVDAMHNPTMSLIYLPHLDYCLQKYGLDFSKISKDLNDIDKLCEDLINYFEERGVKVILLSEYAINNASNPVHINKVLREHGFLKVRKELAGEILDAGASSAFAVADHQVAHIYVNNERTKKQVKELLTKIDGIESVLDEEEMKSAKIDHERAGDLMVVAAKGAWFTYYYWLEDANAPDFARTVDIHRKPGYDPVEMFVNPDISMAKLNIGWKLVKKKMGFRTLMNVIPLDPSLVKGSHGRFSLNPDEMPVLIADTRSEIPKVIDSTSVHDILLAQLFPSYAPALSERLATAL